MTSTNYLAQFQLYANPNERLLICCHRECGFALSVARSQVTSHLREKHSVPEELRKGLTQYLNKEHPHDFRDPATLPTRSDGSPPHPKLQLHEGYACRLCHYRTTNPFKIAQHLSKEHRNGQRTSRSELDNSYDDVYLQTWTHLAHGVEQQYWVVKVNGSLTRPVADQDTCAHLQSMHERERKRLESRSQARAYSQDTGPETLATTRPWMERTRWAITYNGVRRDVLQALAEVPSAPPYTTDHFLGHGTHDIDPEILSPRQDEQKIAALMTAVDLMLDRCEETMQHTSRILLCWLRSTKPHTCYPKPFTLVALESSKKKYRRLWKSFIAFIFCAYRMPRDVRREVTGIRFSRKKLSQLQTIWEQEALSDINFAQGWTKSRDRNGSARDGAEEERADSEEDDESEGGDDEDEDNEEDDDGDDDSDGDSDGDGDSDDGESGTGEKDDEGSEDENQDENDAGIVNEELSSREGSDALDELLELVF